MTRVIIFIAEGFGSGRVPFAPGTAGSLLGVGWFALLLWPGNLWLFSAGTLAGLVVSVWFCGAAERALQRKDPPSVVLDEIAALPICFTGWLCLHAATHHELAWAEFFLTGWNWLLTAGVFVVFRVFDVLKPWPIGWSQKLPGGWGITLDDVLAAVYTALLTAGAGFLASRS